MKNRTAVLFFVAAFLSLFAVSLLDHCPPGHPPESPDGAVDAAADTAPAAAADATTITFENKTDAGTTVYVAFGANSGITSASWPPCGDAGALNCNFPLAAGSALALPAAGYLNATVSFGGPVTCNTTKAELNVNNPAWYDIVDVSLVDGWNGNIAIATGAGAVAGPTVGAAGNEKVFGVFPFGCDICVARQKPPCGLKPGADGCKTGTQDNPDVPCQYQGAVMGGGSEIKVSYLGN